MIGRFGMSRKKRVWYPGATYHVMSRGNRNRENCYYRGVNNRGFIKRVSGTFRTLLFTGRCTDARNRGMT